MVSLLVWMWKYLVSTVIQTLPFLCCQSLLLLPQVIHYWYPTLSHTIVCLLLSITWSFLCWQTCNWYDSLSLSPITLPTLLLTSLSPLYLLLSLSLVLILSSYNFPSYLLTLFLLLMLFYSPLVGHTITMLRQFFRLVEGIPILWKYHNKMHKVHFVKPMML